MGIALGERLRLPDPATPVFHTGYVRTRRRENDPELPPANVGISITMNNSGYDHSNTSVRLDPWNVKSPVTSSGIRPQYTVSCLLFPACSG